ncbi:MAG: type II toxin-antitoxin system HigB family toxin [Deltaproteobacteria bacterium]|nr:type II toxin-antitoxin system HigB family toxin [Deltaproteobacteria bacterium]
MEVRGRKKVIDFLRSGNAKAKKLFPGWLNETDKASWNSPADIRNSSRTVDFLYGNRVVFNIGGNDYRIVAEIDYRRQVVLIRWVGYHKDYDRIDARLI